MTTPPPTGQHPGIDPVAGQTDRHTGPVIDWDAEEEAAETARTSSPSTRRWWVFGGVAVVVMVVMAVVWGLSATMGRVGWTYTGHDLVSDQRVDVRVDLTRDPDRAVTCQIRAMDERGAVVGRADVQVEPSASSPSRHVLSVRTAAPAQTGYVEACWYSDEAPIR